MDELLQQLETTPMKDTFKELWDKGFVVIHQMATNYSLNQLALHRAQKLQLDAFSQSGNEMIHLKADSKYYDSCLSHCYNVEAATHLFK
jgi:hypothetical protein